MGSSFAHAQSTLSNVSRQLQISVIPDVASDGSGKAPYLHSAPFVLFAVESILIGVFLVAFGKRAWKATTGLGLGLALELVVWVVVVNTLPASGFSPSSTAEGRKDIAIWAIVSASGIIGVVVGSIGWMWIPGMVAMGGCGGLSLALSVVMMGDDDLPPVARWIILGLFTVAGLILAPSFQRSIGMVIATALTGSFLVFLGVDLLVNKVDGMSFGLRYLLDHNPAHSAALQGYRPLVCTRVFLAMIWVLATIASVGQAYIWRHAPFIRTYRYLNHFENSYLDHQLTREQRAMAPSPSELSPDASHDTVASGVTHHYPHTTLPSADEKVSLEEKGSIQGLLPPSEATRDARFELVRGHQNLAASAHAKEMTSPDEPPSRPASIVSTEFAQGLRSRPPTFFDEPTSRPVLATSPQPTLLLEPDVPVSPTDVSFNIPIRGIPAASSTSHSPREAFIPAAVSAVSTVEPDLRPDLDTRRHSSSTISSSSQSSRRSWRKPVPTLENLTLSRESTVHHNFERGLTSGRDVSLPPLTSTPSSNAELSTSSGASFGFPCVPGAVDPGAGLRKDATEIHLGSSRVRSPDPMRYEEAIDPPPCAAVPGSIGDLSGSSRSFEASFKTASEASDDERVGRRVGTPELGHGRSDSVSVSEGSTADPRTPTTGFGGGRLVGARKGTQEAELGRVVEV